MGVFMLRDYGILNTRGVFLSHISHSRPKVILSVRLGFSLYVLVTAQSCIRFRKNQTLINLS